MGTDLFTDYIFFYLAAMLLAVLKFAGFIAISWVTVGIPVYIALALFVLSLIVEWRG